MELTRTDLIILALLAENKSHGWELDTQLQAIGANYWAEYSRPHLYYSLRKLEKNGFAKLIPIEKGELKKVYEITAKGKKALKKDDVVKSLLYNNVYFDFDLLLSFADKFRSSGTLKDIISARREMLQKELTAVQELWQQAENAGDMNFGNFAVIRHRIKFLKSELDYLKWLDKNTADDWNSLQQKK